MTTVTLHKSKAAKERRSPLYIVIFVVLAVYILSMAFPLFWGVSTSLKSQAEFRQNVRRGPGSGRTTSRWRSAFTRT